LPSVAAVAQAEQALLDEHASWCQALADLGLSQERRALRVLAQAMRWQWLADDVLEVAFTLRPGRYATVVLRELMINKEG
jgi:tRNA pseudouridine13 synthase